MAPPDPVGAFCDYGDIDLQARSSGPLAGLTFGVKDLYDVAGVPTGAGSPEWRSTHPIPTTNAWVVQALLEAGARLVGKTHTDELAWSLNGQNHHYGTPVNAAAPGRIPGGSSSGSAAATAAGLVDFAIGSDTGGSVRLPASYCGLYGLRPTHGRIPMSGAVPLSPSYDTVGWFARDAATLARVGAVLLPDARPAEPIRRVLVAEDLFALAGPRVTSALAAAVARTEGFFGEAEKVELAGGDLAAWRDAFRIVQSAGAWATHGEWVTRTRPALGPGIRERFAIAAALAPADIAAAKALRERARQRLLDLLPPGTIVVAPTSPGIAPLLTSAGAELEDFRAKALALLCPAGHAGLPQLAMPLAMLDGCPLGLSIIAGPGQDETLMDAAVRIGGA